MPEFRTQRTTGLRDVSRHGRPLAGRVSNGHGPGGGCAAEGEKGVVQKRTSWDAIRTPRQILSLFKLDLTIENNRNGDVRSNPSDRS